MKKLFSIVLLACMTLFAVSCEEPVVEDNTSVVVEPGETVFTATLAEPGTKVELNEDATGLHVLWSPGDVIAIFHDGRTSADAFTSQNTEPASTTTFTGTLTPVETSTDPYFYAIFPKHGSADKYENGVLKPQLNSSQIYANPGTFSYSVDAGGSGAVFVGRSLDHSIQFYNVCSFLRFKVTEREDIRSVVLTSANDKGICGNFDVTFDENGFPHTTEGSKTSITLSPADGGPFAQNQWYYITLLPVTFDGGMTITLNTDTKKAVRTINNTTYIIDGITYNSLTFSRNECRSIQSIDGGATFNTNLNVAFFQNEKKITKTTLWPNGTTQISASLMGPVGPVADITLNTTSDNITLASDGTVTALSAGTATITATTTYDNEPYTAECTIVVTEAASQLVEKEFTVDNAGTKVCFSSGNLYVQKQETDSSYACHSYQGEIISNSGNWNPYDNNIRDLLTWSEISTRTPNTAAGTDIPRSFSFSNSDNTSDITWKALTESQWSYVLFTRVASTVNNKANAHFAKATINGIEGLILFPDEYKHPENLTKISKESINNANPLNEKGCDFSLNKYYDAEWEKLEKAGVVFLPCAGYKGTSWATDGRYWSSSTRNQNPVMGSRLIFSSSGKVQISSNAKTDYMSVRLVRFVN